MPTFMMATLVARTSPCQNELGGKEVIQSRQSLPFWRQSSPAPARVIFSVSGQDRIAGRRAAVGRHAGKVLKAKRADFYGLGMAIRKRGNRAPLVTIDNSIRIVRSVIGVGRGKEIK